MTDKPYPWTCGKCAQKRVEPVVGDYSVDFKHDGKLHNIVLSQIEIPTCQNCGNVQTGIEIGDKVTKALHEKVGLLSPEEIRQQRTALDLNQEQFGGLCDCCRWSAAAAAGSAAHAADAAVDQQAAWLRQNCKPRFE